jgi:retron-type reverse transcriptase
MQNNLYEKIYAIDNLYLASKKALKGKKSTQSASEFWMNEDKEIFKIHQLLKDKRYTFGRYREFNINDKGILRKISAAPFRDRVVHHAIMNIIEKDFEKSFIYDTYANRKNKGVSKALYRVKYYMKKYKYYLKIDIQKYFPSIDHEILKQQLLKKIKCEDTMHLLSQLIDTSNKQHNAYFYFKDDTLFSPYDNKKGIPLGNLTSQFFGNVYLNRFDHYVKEVLGLAYIRYVDDMILFSNEKLDFILKNTKEYLSRFRLKVHPKKIVFGLTKNGVEILGHKIYEFVFQKN